MTSARTTALCCVLILTGTVALGAAPEFVPGPAHPPTGPGFAEPAWSWDMDDYRVQQGPFRQAGGLEPDGWPGRPLSPTTMVPERSGESLLALIAEDEFVAENEFAAESGETPVLLRALGRLTTQLAPCRQWCTDVGDHLFTAATGVTLAFQRFVAESNSTSPRPTEALVAVPWQSLSPDPDVDGSVPTGIGYPGYREYWHEIVGGGTAPDVAAPTSQPSVGSVAEAEHTHTTSMDVTESPGPVDYDPYTNIGLFGKRFARDEEQFRY